MGYVLDKPKRLTLKQVRKLRKSLARNGEADIRVGSCRFVSKGVEVCRDSHHGYQMIQKRDGSTRALRRAAAARGTRYI